MCICRNILLVHVICVAVVMAVVYKGIFLLIFVVGFKIEGLFFNFSFYCNTDLLSGYIKAVESFSISDSSFFFFFGLMIFDKMSSRTHHDYS